MATSTKTLLFNKRALTIQTRLLSSQTLPRRASIVSDHSESEKYSIGSIPPAVTTPEPMPPLSILPFSSVIRSLAITSISSSKLLLPPSLAIMKILANTKSPLLSPDHNPLLRYFLKKTFYAHFCAGENSAEVKRTVDGLRDLGFSGVVLAYAKEVVLNDKESASLSPCSETETPEQIEACIQNEILPWKRGTLETVQMTNPGDFVALKFTGAGSQALYTLSKNLPPSPALRESIDEICHLATARGVRLLFDAEQASLQKGIDAWTLEWMKKCNKGSDGKAVVYGTYQAYLKACSDVLASHLQSAKTDGFTLGVKLVRGAYLGSDPRQLIHDTKADTDAAYDGIAESLVRRSYGPYLKGTGSFPPVDVVLAGHNIDSVRKIQKICKTQNERGEAPVELIYAQLQGMADEVSCELVINGKLATEKRKETGLKNVDVPKAYKYLVWGTTGECMKYLLRRANENKDAVQRTKSGRDAMWKELERRFKTVIGVR